MLNDNPSFSKKIAKDQKLSDVRKNYIDLIKDDYVFLTNDKFEISKEDEEDYIVSESMVDGKIYLKSKVKEVTPNKVILNTPLKDSKYLFEKNNLKIYLYNSDKLTKEEEEKAIILMVVGQTGSGKTTLLNAFINLYIRY